MFFVILILSLISIDSYSLYSLRINHERNLIRTSTFIKLNAGFGKTEIENGNVKKPLNEDSKCSCGSQSKYNECCMKHHEKLKAESPSILIQTRYSAYASDNVDYIIATTSRLSPDYSAFLDTALAPQNGMKRWARSIRAGMIAEYFYTRFHIDNIEIQSDNLNAVVTWRHLAIRKLDNVMYPIKEVSHLERVNDSWFYIKGEVMRPGQTEIEEMTSTWPEQVGLKLKAIENDDSILYTSAGKPIPNAAPKSPSFIKEKIKATKNSINSLGSTSNIKKGSKKV